MSMGILNKQGFSYIWIAGFGPLSITPTRKLLPLNIQRDCPLLMKGGVHTRCRDRQSILRYTGVSIVNNRIVIDLSLTRQKLSAPTPMMAVVDDEAVPIEELGDDVDA